MPKQHSHIQQNHQRVRQIARNLNEFMERYGYEVVELPIIEAADLFLTKAGDQIIQKLFTFERHGQELALRPEFTAPAAYYYVTNETSAPVARWQFSGPVFEDDPHHTGGSFQQFSVGAELLGMAGPQAEAEIIAVAVNGASLLGISDWQLVIGHAGLTRQVLRRFNLDGRTQRFLLSQLPLLKDRGKAHVLEYLDHSYLKLNERSVVADDTLGNLGSQPPLSVLVNRAEDQNQAMGGRSREDIARRLMQKRQQALQRPDLEAALDFLEQWLAVSASPAQAFATIEQIVQADEFAQRILDEWRAALDLLAVYEIPPARMTLQPALARSWEYYSGIVFELRTSNDLHLGGGGRYDGLARLIGGRDDVPAVGFAYYMDQMLAAIPSQVAPSNPVLYIELDDGNGSAAVRWAQQLRLKGFAVALCPVGELRPGHRQLLVKPDNIAYRAEKLYTLEQVESLVAALNEPVHE